MKNRMFNKVCRFNKIIILFTFIITMTTLVAVLLSTFNYYYKELRYNEISMNNLPIGSLQEVYYSPNREYTIKSYICSEGETIDWAARCELVNNRTNEIKNIYWEYKIETIDVKWIDDNTVSINDHEISINDEVYDWRSQNLVYSKSSWCA